MRKTKPIVGVKAPGTFILVEQLTEEECLGTHLILAGKKDNKSGQNNQAYILDIGPALEKEKWGLEVGMRVLLQGSYVPVPSISAAERELGIVSPHDIKAVLIEQGIEVN